MNVFGLQILLGYLIHPKMAIFQAYIFGYRYQIGLLQQKKGVNFLMKSPSENGIRIWFHTYHNHSIMVLLYSSSTRQRHMHETHRFVCCNHRGARATTAAVPRYPLAHTSGLNTSRWDRIVTMVATTRALPLSSQSRWHHSTSTRHTRLMVLLVLRIRIFVEDEDSQPPRLRLVVVDARDRRE